MATRSTPSFLVLLGSRQVSIAFVPANRPTAEESHPTLDEAKREAADLVERFGSGTVEDKAAQKRIVASWTLDDVLDDYAAITIQ